MENELTGQRMEDDSTDWSKSLGAVVIGRNEGERLRRCIESLQGLVENLVYVDSGSTDDSVSIAESLGAEIVILDNSEPFTAARARNLGYKCLLERNPKLSYVQFVDGDCEVVKGWTNAAVKYLDDYSEYAVVCGRRSERLPRETVYNLLCDIEWNTPIGDAASCGGDAVIRVTSFDEVSGYNPNLIAGEEPEMCFRLREKDWKISRIDHEMTLHDADMTRFSQWWKRSIRSGHAYAEGHAFHGNVFDGFNAREVWSISIWAFFVPAFGIAMSYWTHGASLLIFLGYGYLWWRIRRYRFSCGDNDIDSTLYSNYCVLGKFAQGIGVTRYWVQRIIGQRSKLIEYK